MLTDVALRNLKPKDKSTRDMRRSVCGRDLQRPFGKLELDEVTAEELRSLCDRTVDRAAVSVHAG